MKYRPAPPTLPSSLHGLSVLREALGSAMSSPVVLSPAVFIVVSKGSLEFRWHLRGYTYAQRRSNQMRKRDGGRPRCVETSNYADPRNVRNSTYNISLSLFLSYAELNACEQRADVYGTFDDIAVGIRLVLLMSIRQLLPADGVGRYLVHAGARARAQREGAVTCLDCRWLRTCV